MRKLSAAILAGTWIAALALPAPADEKRVTPITESAPPEDAPMPGGTKVRLIRRGVSNIVLSPDGKRLAVGLVDLGGGGFGASSAEFVAVHLYDLASGRVTAKIPLDGLPSDIAWLPDGTLWALEAMNTKVRRLDLEKKEVAETRVLARDNHVMSMNFSARVSVSPDKLHLVVAGFDREIAVYDAKDWKRIRSLDGAGKPLPLDGTWSKDGKAWMTAAGEPAEVLRWDIETGAMKRLGKGRAPVEGPDGRLWALTEDAKSFGPVEPKQEEKREWATAQNSKFLLARFSPDGKYVALGLEDGSVKVFDVASAALFAHLGHTQIKDTSPRVSCLLWAPDSTWVAVGRLDGSSEILRPEVPDKK